VEIWYSLSHLGILYQEKSGNPDRRAKRRKVSEKNFGGKVWHLKRLPVFSLASVGAKHKFLDKRVSLAGGCSFDVEGRVARWLVFKPKNPNFGKILRVSDWRMLIYFIAIWIML
jgi:hypothetical protein